MSQFTPAQQAEIKNIILNELVAFFPDAQRETDTEPQDEPIEIEFPAMWIKALKFIKKFCAELSYDAEKNVDPVKLFIHLTGGFP